MFNKQIHKYITDTVIFQMILLLIQEGKGGKKHITTGQSILFEYK